MSNGALITTRHGLLQLHFGPGVVYTLKVRRSDGKAGGVKAVTTAVAAVLNQHMDMTRTPMGDKR